ncbi:S-layer homology domain-containing protein [Paenibacillus frigoriresistens]|uniref:S-layer homology domain-containing protein n=1 Tax=Paenibacillus alginolyticus TaxID=59839 RepID=UPI00156780CA|nr:S-layer homology domain-containing protein [Paenibacillus frigoriresistens]NRF93407.1 S-layer homology domain-containing protein [Paenibacillus frigoriresistens]
MLFSLFSSSLVLNASASGSNVGPDGSPGWTYCADEGTTCAFLPSWSRGAVAVLKEHNLMEGTGTKRFNPNGEATRAEAVTVLMKMLALKGK